MAGNNGGTRDLIEAAKLGDIESLMVLVRAGRDREEAKRALHWAAERGHTEVVKLLVQEGWIREEMDNSGMTALCCAAQAGQTEMVRALVKLGWDIDAGVTTLRGSTAYRSSKLARRAEVLTVLVELGCDTVVTVKDGRRIVYTQQL